MTQKDIAKKVGVSLSTVSRVLSNKDTKAASQKVKEQIWKVVSEEEYIPNSTARELRSQNNKKCEKKYIACIYARGFNQRADSFFSQLASSVEYELFKNGYLLKYSIYAGDLDAETLTGMLDTSEISGIIVMGRFYDDHLWDVVEKIKNVVYVGLNYVENTKHDVVFCDAYKAAFCVLEELYRLGHRRNRLYRREAHGAPILQLPGFCNRKATGKPVC